jgi:hypothetical protein
LDEFEDYKCVTANTMVLKVYEVETVGIIIADMTPLPLLVSVPDVFT